MRAVEHVRRAFPRAGIGLVLLAAAGCTSDLQPAIEMPTSTIAISTHVTAAGRIEPPEPQRSVTLARDTVLRVLLAEYPGFEWQMKTQTSPLLQFVAYEYPALCPTGATGCANARAQQYGARTSGTTTLEFALVATKEGSASASPTAWSTAPPPMSADGPACPTGIKEPPPSADNGCVLGRVTLTVLVR